MAVEERLRRLPRIGLDEPDVGMGQDQAEEGDLLPLTATFRRKDGRTLHVRKATRAEPEQQKIFRALGTDPAPGGIRKMIV